MKLNVCHVGDTQPDRKQKSFQGTLGGQYFGHISTVDLF